MALVDSLGGAFSSGGFSFAGAAGSVGGPMAGFRPTLPGIDISGFGPITGRIGDFDLGSLTSIAGRLSDTGASGLGSLPAGGALLAPLDGFVGRFERLGSADVGGLLTRLRTLADDRSAGHGLDGTLGALTGIVALKDDATVGVALDLVKLVAPGADTAALGAAGRHGAAAAALVRLFGGLMALHSESQRIAETAAAVAGLADPDTLLSRRDRFVAWAGNTDLAARIAAADPADALAADALALEVGTYVADLNAFAATLERGLGFGEAALLQADLPARAAAMDAATALLIATGTDPIRASAEELSAWIGQRLPASFGADVPGLADAVSGLQAMVADAAGAVNALDASAITAPVTRAIGSVVAVVHQVNQALDAVVGGIRSAFEAVRRLVATLDLRPVAEAIQSALAPVVEAIEALDRLLSDALAGLEAAMDTITKGIVTLKTAILDGAKGIKDAFDRVGAAIAAVPLDTVLGALRSGVNEIATALGAIRLEPYFQTAADVSNSAADIIANVPLGMLPDSAKADLDAAVAPLQAIDFDKQVRQVLVQAMDQLLKELDDEVLAEIQTLYQQLVTFLRGIDPAGHVRDWEAQFFQPLIDHLLAIDPDTVLAPVAEAISAVQAQLRGFDIRTQVLGSIQQVFDDIVARFDQFNPATLIGPVVERVAQARQAVLDATGLAHWAGQVDALAARFDAQLAALDPAQLPARLQPAYDAFVASLRSEGEGSLVGSLVAALLKDAMPARPASFRAVSAWMGGGDGAAALHALLDPARTRLEATRDALAPLDVAASAAAVAGFHRALAQAITALPAGSRLKLRLAPLPVLAPAEVLASAIANRAGYDRALADAIAAVAQKQGSGFGEVPTAVQGLRDALRPFEALRDRLLALGRRFGIDLAGRDAASVLAGLLAVFSPAQAVALLQPVTAALRAKVGAIVHDALVAPLQAGIAELNDFIAHIDLGVLRDELAALHAQIRAQIVAVSPAALLGPVLDAFDQVRLHLVEYDPLQPIRATITTFKQAVAELGAPTSPVRPTVMLAGVLAAYDAVLATAGQLDVRALVAPVLDALHDLEHQLDDGLGLAGGAFTHLQQALAQALGTGGGASVGVEVG